MQLEPIGWQSVLAVLAINLCRGGNQVALKLGLSAFQPFATALGRMFFGALTVALWSRWRGISLRPGPAERRPLLNLGLLFTLQITLLHYGADWTSPAYAVVLMNSNPIFANWIAHFAVPGDRLTPRRVLGLAIAFGGICGVFLGTPEARLAPDPTVGNAVIVVSAFLVAVRTIYTQRLVRTIEPAKTAFWQMAISLPFYLAGVLWTEQGGRLEVSAVPVLALAYQGVIVAGFAFTAWAHLLRRHSPGLLTTFSFTVPLFGVAWSAVIFDEAVTSRLVFGVAAVLTGILVATQAAAARPAEAESRDVSSSPIDN